MMFSWSVYLLCKSKIFKEGMMLFWDWHVQMRERKFTTMWIWSSKLLHESFYNTKMAMKATAKWVNAIEFNTLWIESCLCVTSGHCIHRQWRNRRGAGGQCAPQRHLTGKFLLTYQEKRGKEWMEKGVKWRRKKGKWKRKGGKLKWEEGKVPKWGRTFFFFLLTKIVLGLPKWKFSTGKSILCREKNLEKWLCPLRKSFLLCPCPQTRYSETSHRQYMYV